MGTVANLWRHPIKSHGREALDRVTLTAGQTMPWDRHWAVAHEKSKFDPANPKWVMCRNFMIGVVLPDIAGVWAELDEDAGLLTLRHQALDDITFNPDDLADCARFLNWVEPLTHAVTTKPKAVVSAGERGMTDTPYPSITVMNHASHTAVSDHLGGALEPERWRGNIWLDGLPPWDEMNWTGGKIRIGGATLLVQEPARRCKHTMANPVTGKRDADTLGVLEEHFGHQHFGMYCEVVDGGEIVVGDTLEVL